MKILRSLKFFCKVYLVIALSGVSGAVLAKDLNSLKSKMISTNIVLNQVTRAQTEAEVRNFLNNSEVQKQLVKQGVAPEEVSGRLATLSDHELGQLSDQVKEARAGGDILIAVLLVVLIIYLIRRI